MPKRVDTFQTLATETLRHEGASVQPLHTIGRGCPDLLVGWYGRTYLLELKSRGGKLTSDEAKWHREWRGRPVVLIEEMEQLYDFIKDVLYKIPDT